MRYKSGSTAVDSHCGCTGKGHKLLLHKLSETMKSSRSIFTFVKDPIDHFISGFIECQYRVFNHWDGGGYDGKEIKTPHPVKPKFVYKYLGVMNIPGQKYTTQF